LVTLSPWLRVVDVQSSVQMHCQSKLT